MVQYKRKPHKYKKRKPLYKYRWFWFTILFLALGYAIFYTLFLASFFQIKEITINDLEKIPKEELELKIRLKLENKLLRLPHRNIFLVKLKKIKQEILEEYPLLESITIKRKLPQDLYIVAEERQFLASFCSAETCFALDQHGIIFEIIEKTDPAIVINNHAIQLNLGEKVIDLDQLTQIIEINTYLREDLMLPVEDIIIYATEKLIVRISEGWEVYFNLQENINWQLVKLQVLLKEKLPFTERKNLEWIELRYGNFANPKYKN